MKKVTKAIIPAAGYGTRFLPQTKAMPKEMLPIVDKPVIQYVVEEAVSAGILDVILVTGSSKRAIEDHFDQNHDLENFLEKNNKREALEEIKRIASLANFIYVRQKGPYGNAVPVITAKHLVEEEPFLVLWGDDFIHAAPSRSKQLIDVYEKYNVAVLSLVETKKEGDKEKYAFVEGPEVEPGVIRVERMVEKPGKGYTASRFASVSGYLLIPEILPILEGLKPGKGGELWLPEAIMELAKSGRVYARVIENGQYYDTGDKLGYLKAVIDFSLRHPDFQEKLKDYLNEKLNTP